MKGDLIFVKTYGWIGKRIREVTASEFNHVGMFITNDCIVEAKMSGVVVTPFKLYKKRQKEGKLDFSIYRFHKLTKNKRQGIIDFLIDKVGDKYDFLQLLSLYIYFLFKIDRKKEPIDIRNMWICSELIAEAFYSVGLKFKENIDPDNITPGDIIKSELIYKVNKP